MRDETSCASSSENDELPPVRASMRSVEVIDTLKTIKPNSQRIAASDYNQWEKYDAGMMWAFSFFLNFLIDFKSFQWHGIRNV